MKGGVLGLFKDRMEIGDVAWFCESTSAVQASCLGSGVFRV